MAPWHLRYIPTKPKAAKGGIKTQTKRGALAKTWWGKHWIETLESFPVGSRLARGKTYARSGQVTDLAMTSKGVSAKVQGSRSKPYTVTIKLNPYSKIQLETLTAKLSAKPLFIAQLLNNEMPESIEQECKTAKIPLFPEKYNDLQTRCSCPDYSNPCKHIAAVFYLMAEAFDQDPFLLFTLRGIDKEEFLKKIGYKRQAAGGDEPQALPEPLPSDHGTFWGYKPLPDPLFTHTSPVVHASMAKRLGAIPYWRSSKNFISIMETTYARASLFAEKMIDIQTAEQEKNASKNSD